MPQDMFWLGFTGQTVVAVSQVFILNVPPRLAAVWFGADQVSSACSIGVFGNQVSNSILFLFLAIKMNFVYKDNKNIVVAKLTVIIYAIINASMYDIKLSRRRKDAIDVAELFTPPIAEVIKL